MKKEKLIEWCWYKLRYAPDSNPDLDNDEDVDTYAEFMADEMIKDIIEPTLQQERERIIKKLIKIQELADKEQAMETDIALQELIKDLTNK